MTSNYSNPHHTAKAQLKYEPTDNNKTMTIKPQDLNIVWGGDDRYWNIPADREMAAELYQVSWLEVIGCVDETNPDKNYEVWFELSLAPDAFGWGASPIYFMVKRGRDGKFSWTKFPVNPDETGKFKISGKLMSSQKNKDQYSPDDKKLYFGLYEVWSEKWKGGLRIHNAYVKEI